MKSTTSSLYIVMSKLKTKIQSIDYDRAMAEKKDRKTKRKVNLVSSHSDNERDKAKFSSSAGCIIVEPSSSHLLSVGSTTKFLS